MDPPDPSPDSQMRRLACVRCGAAFACGANTGACWCAEEDFRLPMPAAGSDEDCLCPACLRQAAASSGLVTRAGG